MIRKVRDRGNVDTVIKRILKESVTLTSERKAGYRESRDVVILNELSLKIDEIRARTTISAGNNKSRAQRNGTITCEITHH